VKPVSIGTLSIGGGSPLAFIIGPCVIESAAHAMETAMAIREIAARTRLGVIFKASYDKANRTSRHSFRGPGLDEGLRVLADIKVKTGLPILTDIHEPAHAAVAAQVVDVLQIPAFLSRQTDLLIAAARTGKIVNVKKGQFLSPWEMKSVVEKMRATGNNQIMVCERGASFGYNNLISDMRSLVIMRETQCPVVFDATHSVQLPGGQGGSSGGQREFVPALARAAVAVGISGLFLETHPNPDKALSDGPNSWPLAKMESLLRSLIDIDQVVKRESL
jgi:2-dehydro-3-deoxyphosphooctonate aldolase (KDO 8-P synthase)